MKKSFILQYPSYQSFDPTVIITNIFPQLTELSAENFINQCIQYLAKLGQDVSKSYPRDAKSKVISFRSYNVLIRGEYSLLCNHNDLAIYHSLK